MGKPIIWSGTNAKLINSGDLIDKNNLSLTNGAKITVTQASHGFTSSDVGCPLYLNGSTWTKAIASASNTAEVAGFIYAVIDSNTLRIASSGQCPVVGANFLEGGGSLTAGDLYFLSPTTAGKVTATEPTTVGSVSKPVAIATSTTAIQFFNMRGYVVGAANARTQISLSNNTTGNVQDVTPYDAGNITGWVYIDATTDYRFYVSISWAKNGAGTNWNINYSTVGDTPPAGFSFTITSGGIIQYTMPNVTGFVSSQFNYAINAPAVGTLFPLSIDGSAVVSGTVAAARLPANLSVTELQAATASGITFKEDGATITGTVSDAGAWVLGKTSSGATTGLSVKGTGSSTLVIDRTSSTGAASGIELQGGGTKNGRIISDSTNAISIENSSGSNIAVATQAGLWTLGPTNYTGIHVVNGYAEIRSPTMASGDGISTNYRDGSNVKAEIGVYWAANNTGSAGYLGFITLAQSRYFLWQNAGTWYTGSTTSNVGTTTGTVVGTQTSDERLKTNIKEIQYGLSTIQQLQPVSFEMEGKAKIGFTAQRTENVLPEAVYDTGDVIVEGERTKLAMDYSSITPVLVKAVQELKAELDAAKAEIELLKSK